VNVLGRNADAVPSTPFANESTLRKFEFLQQGALLFAAKTEKSKQEMIRR
jgi:hypothetical protein